MGGAPAPETRRTIGYIAIARCSNKSSRSVRCSAAENAGGGTSGHVLSFLGFALGHPASREF
jgi:hypothetical protein